MKYIWSIIFITIHFLISAQSTAEIKSHFSAIRQGRSDQSTHFSNDSLNYSASLREMNAYYNDSTAAVRKEAYYLTRVIGEKTHDKKIRKQVTTFLSQALKDKDPAIAIDASEGLTRFRQEDFSKEAKDIISTMLEKPGYTFNLVVRLAGFLNLTDQKSNIGWRTPFAT